MHQSTEGQWYSTLLYQMGSRLLACDGKGEWQLNLINASGTLFESYKMCDCL
jgi:hypothetical protein